MLRPAGAPNDFILIGGSGLKGSPPRFGGNHKTDARDALHLAKLLRLDEYVPVRVPTESQESARDLVRSREAARGDLMRARHRVSKLLLRHGI